MRNATERSKCKPEHWKIQDKLVKKLERENPTAKIICEENYIDVTMKTGSEIVLYEIKSDKNPQTVIRNALGQMLEYAYHPRHRHMLPVRLVIVGREAPSTTDKKFLDRLNQEFSIPISYQTISI